MGAEGLIPSDDVRFALAGTAASVVLVALNSALIAPMIRWVNGHPMRQLFSYQTLSTEFVFAALGVVLAAFWTANPWLVPFAIAPLLLIHRALSVPQLQAEARVDPKTGLFNARYFASALTEELGRAQRFERPLSLIMADLDLLREINNTYGHLAGDAVLKGIAEVFRAELRHYDVPCTLRRRGVLDPPAGDAAGAGPRDRGADPARDRRAAVRRRDLERADPRDRVDRRRRLPEGRAGSERAHPPGGPRGVPRQAAGAQPRPRRELRAAADARRPQRSARDGPGGRRPPRAAGSRSGGRSRAANAATQRTRPADRASSSFPPAWACWSGS